MNDGGGLAEVSLTRGSDGRISVRVGNARLLDIFLCEGKQIAEYKSRSRGTVRTEVKNIVNVLAQMVSGA